MVVEFLCAVRGLHMGEGMWLLLMLLFRMIAGFLLMRGARECATSTAVARAGIGLGLGMVRSFALAYAGTGRADPQR